MTYQKMFYCEDCAQLLSLSAYYLHDASHSVQDVEVNWHPKGGGWHPKGGGRHPKGGGSVQGEPL